MGLRDSFEVAFRRRVFELVRPFRRSVIGMAILSFAGGSLEAMFIILVTRVALTIADGEDAFDAPAFGIVGVQIAIVVGLVLLVARLVVSLWAAHVTARLVISASNSYRTDLSVAYLRASWATQEAEPVGRLQQLTTDFAERASEIVVAFTSTVAATLNLLALLIVALIISPVATVAVVLALAVLAALLAPLRRRLMRRAKSAAASQMDFAKSISELGSLGQEMQVFGVRDSFVAEIDNRSEQWAGSRVKVLEIANSVLPIYTTLAYAAVVLGLASAVAFKPSDLAGIGAVMLLMLRSLTYGQQLQQTSTQLASSMPFLDELDATLARYRSDPSPTGSVIPLGPGRIQFVGVGFAYVASRPVLRDLNFAIEPGEVIGVIGPSGAGKSTLTELLLGLRDADSGHVQVDGVDLREIDRASWSSRLGFVPQEARLLTGTVADNIRFFRDDLSEEVVRTAAVRANLLGDVDLMPEGFHSHLGERGLSLSGGQRQRLSIARALAGSPSLLVLDEPTSALDVRSEGLIRDSIARLRGQVTVIIVAHRMSTLDVCDRIMVIEGGELIAFEPPGVLRSRSDFYREALKLSGIS